MDHPKSTTNRQKQKKLEYTSVGVGLDECTITKLPDSLFIKGHFSTPNIPFGLHVDSSYCKGIPLGSSLADSFDF